MGAGTTSQYTGSIPSSNPGLIGRLPLTKLGIVTALPGEARWLAGHRCAAGARVALADGTLLQLSGMGCALATAAAERLADEGVSALLSWGCAGALTPKLDAGALLMPAQLVSATGKTYEADAAWRARLSKQLALPAHEGLLLTTDQPLNSVQQKAQWQQRSGADAVDMESAAIAAVAVSRGLPFLVIRAVADTAVTAIPEAAQRALSTDGHLQIPEILKSLAKNPLQLRELMRLGRSFRLAQARLSQVADISGPSLCAP